MKIKSIQLENHPVLGDLVLDFTDKDGRPVDTIIIAGENGTGKSSLLNVIFDFSYYHPQDEKDENERRTVNVEFTPEEVSIMRTIQNWGSIFNNGLQDNSLRFHVDFSRRGNWEQILFEGIDERGVAISRNQGHIFNQKREIFKSIFSDVEINFTPNLIQNVTAKDIDSEVKESVRSKNDLATQITQLLIDVQSLDDGELGVWVKQNSGKAPPTSVVDSRMRRFKDAFNFMFDNIKFSRIANENGLKKVLFKVHDKEIPIEQLSSGEKQIIFRGGFLLQDQKSNKGALVLIDEPEISMHPRWQLKILEFYKRLFQDEHGNQTSQIFVVTHSPFIIHNSNRHNDKVIVFKRNHQGQIEASDDPEFYGWTEKKLIHEAFQVDWLSEGDLPVVLTEGKTDAKLLNNAWQKLYPDQDIPFKIISSGLEINDEERQGNAEHVRRALELVSTIMGNDKIIIGLFDNDREGSEQFKGLNKKAFEDYSNDSILRKHRTKNIYGMLLPVPIFRQLFVTESDITQRYFVVEHYFENSILSNYNLIGDTILTTELFYVKEGSKVRFANESRNFEATAFQHFEILFQKLKEIAGHNISNSATAIEAQRAQ